MPFNLRGKPICQCGHLDLIVATYLSSAIRFGAGEAEDEIGPGLLNGNVLLLPGNSVCALAFLAVGRGCRAAREREY